MHPEYTQSQMIANVCAQCGETYYRRWPSLVGRFCSIKCTNLSKLQPIAARFWSKVRKTRTCWWWLAGTTARGYGKFWIDGRTVHAHRVAWELVNGPMDPGLVARHKCDNPLCVRPDHVVPGTNLDNTRDMVERGRMPLGEAHKSAKLTAAQVIEIRARRARGEKVVTLAAEYGMSQSRISAIGKGKGWRQLS